MAASEIRSNNRGMDSDEWTPLKNIGIRDRKAELFLLTNFQLGIINLNQHKALRKPTLPGVRVCGHG